MDTALVNHHQKLTTSISKPQKQLSRTTDNDVQGYLHWKNANVEKESLLSVLSPYYDIEIPQSHKNNQIMAKIV